MIPGKHLLPKAKLHDNEPTCCITTHWCFSAGSALEPSGINKLMCWTCMYSDDTQPGRAALIDPRILPTDCTDSIAGPC